MLELIDSQTALNLYRSLDAALDDDDAAIRVLNNNIDGNGTGSSHSFLSSWF